MKALPIALGSAALLGVGAYLYHSKMWDPLRPGTVSFLTEDFNPHNMPNTDPNYVISGYIVPKGTRVVSSKSPYEKSAPGWAYVTVKDADGDTLCFIAATSLAESV